MMLRILTLVVLFFVALPVETTTAHNPYYTQTERLNNFNGQEVFMKLLHGDGIFFADPIRAVVVDTDGNLLAASPVSKILFVSCNHSNASIDCIAYDGLKRQIYTPDRSNWRVTETLEIADKPQNYPEHFVSEYGFLSRSASILETVKFEVLSVKSSPVLSIVALVWWLVVWMLIAPLYWQLKSKQLRTSSVSITSIIPLLVHLIAVAMIMFITAYGWLLSPYSISFLIAVSLIGAICAFFLTKPKLMEP